MRWLQTVQLIQSQHLFLYAWGMSDAHDPSLQAMRAARPAAPIGARPILWRGWLAGLAISVALWGALAAVVVYL